MILNLWLLLLLNFFQCFASQCGKPQIPPNISNKRIILGYEATPNSWPWIVSIRLYWSFSVYLGTHMCAGSLIDRQYVITAAHCVQVMQGAQYTNPQNFAIIVGIHNLNDAVNMSNVYPVDSIVINKNFVYSDVWKGYDIALLRLKKPVQLSNSVGIICLPEFTDPTIIYGKQVSVIGW